MASVAATGKIGLADFAADRFEALVGQTIVFERPADSGTSAMEAASMRLLEVKRGAKSPAVRREPFSVLFAMKDQPPLGPGLHRLAHPDFEPAELLITRVMAPKYEALDPTGMYYEVVFG